MAIPASLIPETTKLEQGVWIYLVTQWLDLDTAPSPAVVRLARYDENVTFDSNVYTSFAFEVDTIQQNAKGEIEQTRVTFASPNGVFQSYLEQNEGLKGRRCTIALVHEDHLGDPASVIEFKFRVFSASYDSNNIILTLSTRLDEVLLKVPIRRFSKLRCTHVYKHEGCWLRSGSSFVISSGFIAATTGDGTGNTCSKILDDSNNGCLAHTNTKRFGGFPGIGDRSVFIRG